jgi:LuxR family glucitol operon transcriptional activator
VQCNENEKAETAFENILYHKDKANQIELIYYHYGMAQLFARKGELINALQSNQKSLNLIDSWGQTISIREEVEIFNELIKNGLSSVH